MSYMILVMATCFNCLGMQSLKLIEASLLPHYSSVGLSLAVGILTKLTLAVRSCKSQERHTAQKLSRYKCG